MFLREGIYGKFTCNPMKKGQNLPKDQGQIEALAPIGD
jgi:hypothetical protein